MLKLHTEMIEPFIGPEDFKSAMGSAMSAYDTLISGNGPGGNMTGWLDLPVKTPQRPLADCRLIASRWLGTMDVVVVVGIGGSLEQNVPLRLFRIASQVQERGIPLILYLLDIPFQRIICLIFWAILRKSHTA